MIRKLSVAGAAGVLGLVILYLVFNWMMNAAVHSRREVMVPDLKGKSIDESLTVLGPLNLGLKKAGEEIDENLPAGTIIRQTPPAGMNVREGKIVRVTVSQGGEVIYVPDVTGQGVRAAEIALRSAGLTVGEETSRYSVLVEKGQVISQDPKPGETVDKYAVVNFVYSDGRPPAGIRLMPDWEGNDLSAAQAWAEENGFGVEVIEIEDPEAPQGTVTGQVPGPDTDLSGTGTVSFTVSVSTAPAGPGTIFYYEIPQGSGERRVRVTLLDEKGEREVFDETRAPGTKLEIPVNPRGSARVRVFINGILVEERELL